MYMVNGSRQIAAYRWIIFKIYCGRQQMEIKGMLSYGENTVKT
jgi:hypothetical protein